MGIFLAGRLTPEVREAVGALARQHNLRVFFVDNAAQGEEVVDSNFFSSVIEFINCEMSFLNNPASQAWLGEEVHGLIGYTQETMEQTPFLTFLRRAWQANAGAGRLSHTGTAILRLAVRTGLNFADLSPQQAFKTPPDSVLKTNEARRLVQSGIEWIELLAYLTERQVFSIRNLGAKGQKQLIATLTSLESPEIVIGSRAQGL